MNHVHRPGLRRLAAASLAAAAISGNAQAHPRFTSAVPGRGEAVAASPAEVRVTFSEAVDVRASTMTVLDSAYMPVAVGRVRADPKDRKTLVLPISRRLAPGSYHVQWRVVAPGHGAVPGRYRFEVKPSRTPGR